MRAVIQRVSNSKIKVDNKTVACSKLGLLIYLGIENQDTIKDIEWLSNKIVNLRIFNDLDAVMNKSINEVNGTLILVSQFTLFASTKKGNRPSYVRAAKQDVSFPLYLKFIKHLEPLLKNKIQTGVFGSDMKVTYTNDGPVTIFIDSKKRE